MPTGKGFALKSDLNLRQALLDGYERHTRRSSDDLGPSASKRQKRYALPRLKISAMANDTVATLTSLAYSIKSLPNSRVVMGLVVGMGCNATVPMKLTDLHESKTRHIRSNNPAATEAVVSTEWTLSYTGPPLKGLNIVTEWDTELDLNCDRPGFQPLEYMIGGRYIGELIRIITCDYMTSALHIPREALPENLVQEYALTTDFVSFVIAPSRSDAALATELSQKLPPPESSDWNWTPASAGAIRAIASTVQTRSAALVAAATVGLLSCTGEIKLTRPGECLASVSSTPELNPPISSNKPDWCSGPEELVVAFSGGVIQHYPNYRETCQKYIDRLILHGGPQDGGKSIFLREASDGAMVGAGILAGIATGKIEGIIGSTFPGTNSQALDVEQERSLALRVPAVKS
jgi:hexokinase